MEQRKNVAKKKRPRRDHVTHHVTHVIDDGGANDGTRKSHVHVHEKTIKSPVLPYNKWEAQPNKGSARSESPIRVSDAMASGVGTSSYVVSDGGTVHQTQTVCSNNGIFEAEVTVAVDVIICPIATAYSVGHIVNSFCLCPYTSVCMFLLNRVPASAGVKAGMSPLPGGR